MDVALCGNSGRRVRPGTMFWSGDSCPSLGGWAVQPVQMLLILFLSQAWGFSVDDDVETNVEKSFHDFMEEYERGYAKGSPEYQERFALYRRRFAEIEDHNSQPDRLWTAGVNTFADRTDAERAVVRGWRSSGVERQEQEPDRASGTELGSGESLVDQMDWRNLSIALQIPDQGSCGSCWALATTSVLEAHHEIYVKKKRTFSPQELVSCVQNPQHCGGKGGCDGATVELGMAYALKSGLSDLTQTPYQGKDTPCKNVKTPILAEGDGDHDGGKSFGLIGWNMLPRNKEAPLARALIDKGPVGVSVAASTWYSYKTGIFNSCQKNCVVDHAVTLYGFHKQGAQKYWLIRNSWGKKWGENGFIRMARTNNEDKHCGMDNQNQKGTGCDKDPKSVKVCGMCGVLYDSVVPTFKGKTTSLVDTQAGQPSGSEGVSAPQQQVLQAVQRHTVAADGAVATAEAAKPSPGTSADSFARLVRREMKDVHADGQGVGHGFPHVTQPGLGGPESE